MKKCIDNFHIKIIAIILMVIDHTGAVLFPDVLILRIIGRLAFPLFAFSISEGYKHTRSVSRYLLRLGICAVVFQIPDWFFGIHYALNIFATLFFGLAAILSFDKLKEKSIALSWIAAIAISVIAECSGADYGAYGVFYILVFYLAAGNVLWTVAGTVILHAAYAAYELIYSYMSAGTAFFSHWLQIYSMLSLPIIALYNNQRGRKMKYFFYLFYPAHLIILYVIDMLISQ